MLLTMTVKRFALVLAVFVLAQLGFAASCMADCATGTTSSCSNNVSVSISDLVQITNIADMSFGSYNGIGDAVLDDDVCIWTNVAAGTYTIKAVGDGASSAFTVSDGGSGLIPYSVKWNNTTGTGGNFALTTNVFSAQQTGASTTSNTCGGGTNANFQVRLLQGDLLGAKPGAYTGVLTLIVAP